MTAAGVATHVLAHGDGLADRILARAGRRAGQPRSADPAVVLLLREARQQIHLAIPRVRAGHASAVRGLQAVHGGAPGALGRPFEIPEGIRIEEILGLALRTCEQHSWSPRCTPVLPDA